ncbi:MAG: hypothetical protein M3Q24_02625 [bacterium]|nr:hypothetical protein [bacterium]
MADTKKPAAPPSDDVFSKVVFYGLGILLALSFLGKISLWLTSRYGGDYDSIWQAIGIYFLQHIWPIIKIFAVVITIGGGFGISRIFKKLSALRMEENLLYGVNAEAESTDEASTEPVNEKWIQIQNHIESKNPSEWRVAIIEADIMLDDLLKRMGYHGDTLGEKLKAVEKSDFTTLESAWEAHKVRNQIAHQGANFQINEREARRVISLFENVFREFKII